MRSAICICLILLSACNTVIWDGSDGHLPDMSCQCPTGDILAEHFGRDSYAVDLPAFSGTGRSLSCNSFAGWSLIGGGCSSNLPYYNVSLAQSGYYDSIEQYHWLCDWHNGHQLDGSVVTSVLCMEPSAQPAMPQGCDCLAVQDFRERTYMSTNSAVFVPETSGNTLTVACEPGDVLLYGGCSTLDVPTSYVRLTSSGFDPDDPEAWRCTWKHLGGPETGTMMARVMCVQPPGPGHAPESQPLAERIVRRSSSTYLRALLETINTSPCLSDEYVLGGSCTLDHSEPASYEAGLNVTAFAPDGDNAWRCGWYEDTNLATIHSTTTALCLRPPEP